MSRTRLNTLLISRASPFNGNWRKRPDGRAKRIWRKRNGSATPGVGHGRPPRAKSGTGRRKRIGCLVSIRRPGRRDSKNSLGAFALRIRTELGNCSENRLPRRRTSKQTIELFTRTATSRTSTRWDIRLAMRPVILWSSWAPLSISLKANAPKRRGARTSGGAGAEFGCPDDCAGPGEVYWPNAGYDWPPFERAKREPVVIRRIDGLTQFALLNVGWRKIGRT